MKNEVYRARVQFGKINIDGRGKRHAADVEMELRKCGGEETFRMIDGEKVPTGEKTPVYIEFSACGNVWNHIHTDIIMGGQCIDHMGDYIKTAEFKRIMKWWKAYHLNGMNAGTPEQKKAIDDWKAAGNRYDYTAACEYLKSINLYEVPFSGLSVGHEWHGEPYKYGHGWIIEEIPAAALAEIAEYMSEKNGENVPEWLTAAIEEKRNREQATA